MKIMKNVSVCVFITLFFALLPILIPTIGANVEDCRANIGMQIVGSQSMSPPEMIFKDFQTILSENGSIFTCNLSSYNGSAVIIIYYTENNTQTIVVPINSTIIESGGRYAISFSVNNTRSLGEFTVTVEGGPTDRGPSHGEVPTPAYTPTETPTSNAIEDNTLSTQKNIDHNHTEFYNLVLALVISGTIAVIALIGTRSILK